MRTNFPGGLPLGREDLRDYLSRVLDEKPATPRAKKGRPSNVSRDYWIVLVLARLAAMYGVPLTRSRRRANDVRPHRRLSACATVAQTLGELGIKLDEAGVEAIWSKRRPKLSPREIDEREELPRSIELNRRTQKRIDARLKDFESARLLKGIE
jgi:hypothetical protein